ncbi:NAD(P)-dependent dehydrogenase, short-chain alcohol dehydrogenase family [Streptomyces sp. 3213]|uniref:SDR family NAD(P)-dependent oxidoreductase n=1 Tax=Streptomyces sp. 3213.3 TaxID=1855348 RepID=UPI000894C71E|nr:SDR family NAD(P)-dependent oxidoreductase [Streptomyces sp. 3213.3]SEE87552.1 NAD(P)-dependent dehydrogenase, short-chain alcohol dehydrogenase family [Streptomyces sp. 3213] [Streptomyces sp. 3213.3]
MTTTFITGANRSLGLETARRLVEAGHTVLLGARDPERGRAAAEALGARFVRIDVTDDDSVRAAAADVAAHEGTVDVLVNNAGVLGKVGPVEEYTAADMSAVLDVNVVGIARVTHAFLPLLRTSPNPVIVNVSSGMGSFGMTQDPARIESRYTLPLYCASKAAVTMLTTQYAKELKDVKVNAADPGQTATDFTGGLGHSVADGAESIVTLATLGPDGPTGRFVDRLGNLPW